MRRMMAGDGFDLRFGIRHGEAKAGMLQHFNIIAAIAERQG